MANIQLARQILAAIKADPSSWNQGEWRTKHGCGTVACFAGHAGLIRRVPWLTGPDGLLPGAVRVRDVNGRGVPQQWASGLISSPGETTSGERWSAYVVADAVTVADWAQRELGITRAQAFALFDADNTLAGLEAMVDALEANPDADLWTISDALLEV